MTVIFELFGPARLRAGHAEITVPARTLGEALRGLATACPSLSGPVIQDGQLSRHFRLSLNGRSFVSDPDLELNSSDRLLLLSAESGG
ncbi:MAG: MoaD/ThiS family protein [Acidobacteria bacterium]|nr:MoaD/ThiS family protein [Acidobacteriota bacterium]